MREGIHQVPTRRQAKSDFSYALGEIRDNALERTAMRARPLPIAWNIGTPWAPIIAQVESMVPFPDHGGMPHSQV